MSPTSYRAALPRGIVFNSFLAFFECFLEPDTETFIQPYLNWRRKWRRNYIEKPLIKLVPCSCIIHINLAFMRYNLMNKRRVEYEPKNY